jgi:hypothetical protein
MKNAIRHVAAPILLAVLASAPASASPIAFSESVSGDLGSVFPATLLPFDAGVNTINGQVSFFGTNFVYTADTDHFAFSVPTGMDVTGIAFAFDTTLTGGATAPSVRWRMDTGNVLPALPVLGDISVPVSGSSSGTSLFASSLPLGPGTYVVENFAVMFSFADPSITNGFTTDYTFQFTVADPGAAVPEPTAMLLLGTGLIGAGVRRYRQRRTRN